MALTEPEISAELIARIAEGRLGLPMLEGDASSVAKLLLGLSREMAPLRAFAVGDREPATTYDASCS